MTPMPPLNLSMADSSKTSSNATGGVDARIFGNAGGTGDFVVNMGQKSIPWYVWGAIAAGGWIWWKKKGGR